MGKEKIIVNPDEMDADIIDCPFADQDSYCGIANGGAAVLCKILEDRFSCPLNAGPVEVRLYQVSDYKPQPMRTPSKGDVDKRD